MRKTNLMTIQALWGIYTFLLAVRRLMPLTYLTGTWHPCRLMSIELNRKFNITKTKKFIYLLIFTNLQLKERPKNEP